MSLTVMASVQPQNPRPIREDLASHLPGPNAHAHANATANADDLNRWLPVTSSRSGNWMYSAFHNVTAMVGAGILSLPYAMSQLGWGAGVTIMVLSWVITLYTMWQMVVMHEMSHPMRYDRYHELGQAAFGPRLGLWIVVPQQLLVEIGLNIVYMITAGQSLQKIHDIVRPHQHMKLSYFIIIFASIHFFLSHLPNLNSITGISLAAAIMSISYSVIAWGACINKGRAPNVSYELTSSTIAGKVFSFLSGLGAVAFSFAGHNVVLEIQATIHSTPDKLSTKPMWKGCLIAYIIVALCYFPVAFFGYGVFGNSVADNVLMSLEKPKWLIITANAFVVIHVIGSYQVYAMPVFDMVESYLVLKMKCNPSKKLRIITRTIYVAFTMMAGITFPFFGALLSFLGGFAFAPTSYYLPCIIWLILKKPARFGLSWWINWICIVIGVIIMVLAPIGALRNIIVSNAKHYKFFT